MRKKPEVLDQNHPLVQFHNSSGLSYRKIGKKVGMGTKSVYNIRNMRPDEMMLLSVGTLIAFQEKLGVELLGYIKEYTNTNK